MNGPLNLTKRYLTCQSAQVQIVEKPQLPINTFYNLGFVHILHCSVF